MLQANLIPSEPQAPTVSLINGRPATTSLEVAKFFDKQHTHVLRSLKDLIDNCPEEFTASNFGLSEYTDETGRTLPMFTLHRDGFMLLVMGYTGKKAMQIKIAYILAFNAMEEQLTTSQKTAPPKPYCTDRDMKPLDAAVNAWAKTGKVTRLEALAKLRAEFGVTRYHRFWPVELIEPATQWVKEQTNPLPKCLPKDLPDTTRLFANIEKAEKALRPLENWTHINVRWELRRKADKTAEDAVGWHVNAAWYALGLARSSLLAAIAVGKIA